MRNTESGSGMQVTNKNLAMYLATFPAYRKACLSVYKSKYGHVRLICSSAQLDKTVKTGIRRQEFTRVPMVRLFGKVYIQVGCWLAAFQAYCLVIDLNPRGLNNWIFLLIRRLAGKRTLVWGHLHPRNGSSSGTAFIRRFMRRLSSGTIVYTPSEKKSALKEILGSEVWVAPNSLYTRETLSGPLLNGIRNQVLYVGRFTDTKKVTDLLEAFGISGLAKVGVELNLIGSGPLEQALKSRAIELGLASNVHFPGWIDEFDQLKTIYSRAFVSTSPGFAGLGLTQSLGFGVPQIISKNERHSPEIELADTPGVIWSKSSEPQEFAVALVSAWENAIQEGNKDFVNAVSERYSADQMAEGLHSAMLGYSQ